MLLMIQSTYEVLLCLPMHFTLFRNVHCLCSCTLCALSGCPCWWCPTTSEQSPTAASVVQASLKRKYEEVSEEKAEAIRTRVKIDLDVKEQEEQAKSDAKTQVCHNSCTLLYTLQCFPVCKLCLNCFTMLSTNIITMLTCPRITDV